MNASGLVLPSGAVPGESNLSGMSIAPVGVGDNFPHQPLPGFLVVKMILPKEIASALITPDQREREIERMAQQIKEPLRGEVVAVGHGVDHSTHKDKPILRNDGKPHFSVGDVVLFRPLGSYSLPVDGPDAYRLIGDQDVLTVEKKRG